MSVFESLDIVETFSPFTKKPWESALQSYHFGLSKHPGFLRLCSRFLIRSFWHHRAQSICWWQEEDHEVIFFDTVYSTSVICVLQVSWDLYHMYCICINGNLRSKGHNIIKMFSFHSPITQTHANNYSQTLYHGTTGCKVECVHCFDTRNLKTNSCHLCLWYFARLLTSLVFPSSNHGEASQMYSKQHITPKSLFFLL